MSDILGCGGVGRTSRLPASRPRGPSGRACTSSKDSPPGSGARSALVASTSAVFTSAQLVLQNQSVLSSSSSLS